MAPENIIRRVPITAWFSILIAGYLTFGLWPFSVRVDNGALLSGHGLELRGKASAGSCANAGDFPFKDGFTMAMSLLPYDEPAGKLADIISFHDREGRWLLRLIQWKQAIIVKVRDGSRILEYGIPGALSAGNEAMLAVTSLRSSVNIYINGRERGSLDRSSLLSAGPECFSIGNSPEGRNPWEGRLSFLAFFSGNAVERGMDEAWMTAGPGGPDTIAAYPFNESSGHIAMNMSSDSMHIVIPSFFRAFKRELLSSGFNEIEQERFDIADVVVNLLGFMPFGFFVLAVLSDRMPFFWRFFSAVAAGGILSFSIESIQLWLPDRHSSLSDLVLNTAGTTAGVLVFMIYSRAKSFISNSSAHENVQGKQAGP